MVTCEDEKLRVVCGGLQLKNPIVAESAGYMVDSWSFKRLIKSGAAAVTTKSTTFHPMGGWPRKWDWSPRPRNQWHAPDGNPMTLSFPEDPGYWSEMDGTEALLNPGYKRMARFIRESKPLAEEEHCHIVGSLSPRSIPEGVQIAQEFEKAGASAIHMDLQCPSAAPFRAKQLPGLDYEKLGVWWSNNPGETVDLVKAIRDAIEIPIWPKPTLPAWYKKDPKLIHNLDEAGPKAYPFMVYRVQGFVWIDVYRGKPAKPSVNNPMPSIVPLTVGTTAQLASVTSTDLIPSGGISTATDVIQLLMAGASATGVCRAFYRDIDVCKKICAGLENYIVSQALNNITDIKGVALPFIFEERKLDEEHVSQIYKIPVPPVEEDAESRDAPKGNN